MRFLFLTLSIFILVSSNAQYSTDTLYRKYTNGLIYRLGGSIMKGNERITFQELSKEFSMSTIGMDQYNLAKRKKNYKPYFTGYLDWLRYRSSIVYKQ